MLLCVLSFFFFFNDTATTEIYTLSLHDALPIHRRWRRDRPRPGPLRAVHLGPRDARPQRDHGEGLLLGDPEGAAGGAPPTPPPGQPPPHPPAQSRDPSGGARRRARAPLRRGGP